MKEQNSIPPNKYREPNNYYQALTEFRMGNYEESIRLLLEVNKSNPDFTSAQVRLAKAYIKLEIWKEAEKRIKIALREDPTYNARGQLDNIRYIIYKNTGQEKEAERYFQSYSEKNPKARLSRKLLVINQSITNLKLKDSGFKIVNSLEGLDRIDWMSIQSISILFELDWYNPNEVIRGGFRLLCNLFRKKIPYTGKIGIISNHSHDNILKDYGNNHTYSPFLEILNCHRVEISSTNWDSRVLKNPCERDYQFLQSEFDKGFLRENRNLEEKTLLVYYRGNTIPIKVVQKGNSFDIGIQKFYGFSKIDSSNTEHGVIDKLRNHYLGLTKIEHIQDTYKC